MYRFWDYHSGNRFQEEQVKVQPGSLESEAGVNCMSFDQSGSRLITGEVDKTIKCEDSHSEYDHCIWIYSDNILLHLKLKVEVAKRKASGGICLYLMQLSMTIR